MSGIAETVDLQRAVAASRCVSLLHFAQDIDVSMFDSLSELEQFDLEFGRKMTFKAGSWVTMTNAPLLISERERYYADRRRLLYRLACGGR